MTLMETFRKLGEKEPESALRKKFYRIKKKLGQGTFGVVKEAVDIRTNETVAIKSIKKRALEDSPGQREMVEREIEILKRIQHPNVISMKDFFETKEKYYLVFELATGGELFDRISQRGKFTERDAAWIIFQILNAIAFLHDHDIVHRDLKPENILYKNNSPDSPVMIADFGVSNFVQGDMLLNTMCGSPGYAAPEVIKRSGHGKPADLWSVGIITFTFLLSNFFEWMKYTAKDFVRDLLQVKPGMRPTAYKAMLHRWLVKYCPQAKENARKIRAAQQRALQSAQLRRQFPRGSSSVAAAAVTDPNAVSAAVAAAHSAQSAAAGNGLGEIQAVKDSAVKPTPTPEAIGVSTSDQPQGKTGMSSVPSSVALSSEASRQTTPPTSPGDHAVKGTEFSAIPPRQPDGTPSSGTKTNITVDTTSLSNLNSNGRPVHQEQRASTDSNMDDGLLSPHLSPEKRQSMIMGLSLAHLDEGQLLDKEFDHENGDEPLTNLAEAVWTGVGGFSARRTWKRAMKVVNTLQRLNRTSSLRTLKMILGATGNSSSASATPTGSPLASVGGAAGGLAGTGPSSAVGSRESLPTGDETKSGENGKVPNGEQHRHQNSEGQNGQIPLQQSQQVQQGSDVAQIPPATQASS
ncbi:hypothetical protein HK102_010542 [Quaeritorhiza haematococci]|nr:hypothetical protein HK102_010542 [Quaeritorhiza haematococci]